MDQGQSRKLRKVCENLGAATVGEWIGVSGDLVERACLGRATLSDAQLAELQEMWDKGVGEEFNYVEDEPSELAAESVSDAPPLELLGIDVDGDGRPDIPVHVMHSGSGVSYWTDEQRMLRDGLRRSLEFAQMSRFRVNMTHEEYVTSLGITTRLELGLISWFREAVPDPNENWDASRRWREIERRVARLRWVSEEEAKEYGGMKGILNRIMGRRKLSGKELFQQMVAEADWMVQAMRNGQRDVDVISEVTGYLGLGSRPPSLTGGKVPPLPGD